MSKLLRCFEPAQTVFVTSVTRNRVPILLEHGDLLRESIRSVQQKTDFEVLAWVIMPNHFHMLLRSAGADCSGLVKRIKLTFSFRYRKRLGLYRGSVWQSRFWDHIVRDQEDLNRHIDYIHYNPVKHGVVARPLDWSTSSIKEFADGYPLDWGTEEPEGMAGEFGE